MQNQDIKMLNIFKGYQEEALLLRDAAGENVLFECAKSGNEELFRYFMGTPAYLRARA